MFEESGQASEINELVAVIKSDITELNGKLEKLQRHHNDTKSQHMLPNQQTNHSRNVVDSLKASLADATKGLQDVLHTRSLVPLPDPLT